MTTALITGITGQDGSYLAEQLLADGYTVHGVVRRSSSFNTARIDHIYDNPQLHLHYGDVLDGSRMATLMAEIAPDEIYHLACQSHVMVSFDMPVYTTESICIGTANMLDAFRRHAPQARFYNAASSEMFGDAPAPQSESSPMSPRSPYAAAKLQAYWMTRNYREAYGLHASNGIMFNHESPRRGPTFVTQKIVQAAVRIKAGLQHELVLGNCNACRDWGFAGDYVRAMRLIVGHHEPGDYVVGTGDSRTVSEFVARVFVRLGLDVECLSVMDQRYVRPTEVLFLKADAAKIRDALGWRPIVGFNELVDMMIEAAQKACHAAPTTDNRDKAKAAASA